VNGAPLIILAPLTGAITLDDTAAYAWRAEQVGAGHALGAQAPIRPGTYEARAHATAAQPGTGETVSRRELYVFVTEDGELRAVQASDADYSPA
jgi:hypothetical protein